MDYTLIRSRRKTLSLELKGDGIIVRAPMRVSKKEIERFVLSHQDWIEKHREKLRAKESRLSDIEPFSDEELKELRAKAEAIIPKRVEHYAPIVGVSYGKITIRTQKSRWGSCSAKGNLNFNCLLMLMPIEIIDSVVVHELCHRKEMNHGNRFYAEVLRVYPEYYKWNAKLKENGEVIMERLRKYNSISEK